MERFVAEFDPLASLEAEYAAVVARTRSDDKEKDAQYVYHGNQADEDDENPVQSDEEDAQDMAMYAQLPDASDDEDSEDQDSEEESIVETTVVEPVAVRTTAPLDEEKKQVIMAAMQRIQLQPPAWMKDTAISDDQLVSLVQQRLQTPSTE